MPFCSESKSEIMKIVTRISYNYLPVVFAFLDLLPEVLFTSLLVFSNSPMEILVNTHKRRDKRLFSYGKIIRYYFSEDLVWEKNDNL